MPLAKRLANLEDYLSDEDVGAAAGPETGDDRY
jgi:hypothetical protein